MSGASIGDTSGIIIIEGSGPGAGAGSLMGIGMASAGDPAPSGAPVTRSMVYWRSLRPKRGSWKPSLEKSGMSAPAQHQSASADFAKAVAFPRQGCFI